METGRGVVGALVAGVCGWLAASAGWLAWLFATGGELGLFAVAAPFWAWSIGYLPGAAVLVAYAAAQAVRGRSSVRAGAWAAAIYLLPVVVVGGVFRLFLHWQPTAVSRGDDAMMMGAFGGPVFFLLYVAGLVAGFAARDKPLRSTVLAFLAPPAAGVVIAGAFFALYTVGSPHWQARADFVLTVKRVEWRAPRGLAIEAELEAKRDVTAVFHAFYEDRSADTGRGEPVQIFSVGGAAAAAPDGNQAWTRTPVALRAGTRYPVRMAWPELATTLKHSRRTVYLRLVEGDHYHGGKLLREFTIGADPDERSMAALESRLSPQGPTGGVGYATPSGKLVIRGPFEWGDEFFEGLALVRIGGRFGYIDATGAIVVPARYVNASRFAEGLAAVMEMGHDGPRAGYIDRTGAIAIPLEFQATHPFAEGLARVRTGGKEGYIDRSGRFVIPPRWESAYDFAGGLAPVRVGERWGFIDPKGALVLEPQFEALQPFQRGRWNAMRGGRWGAVDRSGRWDAEP